MQRRFLIDNNLIRCDSSKVECNGNDAGCNNYEQYMIKWRRLDQYSQTIKSNSVHLSSIC